MGATCRFDDEDAARRLTPGCPLRAPTPSTDERACARCPANAAWPGQATIGCRVIVPGPVWRQATAELQGLSPALLDTIQTLRRDVVDGADVGTASEVVERWIATAGLSAPGREAAATGRAFLRAAGRTGLGVRLWE